MGFHEIIKILHTEIDTQQSENIAYRIGESIWQLDMP